MSSFDIKTLCMRVHRRYPSCLTEKEVGKGITRGKQ
jgi:L-ribulose-5-phosphate 3-epimerase UlaE